MAAATDTAVVVLAPGLGDAVQMAKAGILEVADVFVVNKADRDGAGESSASCGRCSTWAPRAPGTRRSWRPRPSRARVSTSSWAAIEDHREHVAASGALGRSAAAALLREVESLAAERFRAAAAAALAGATPPSPTTSTARRIDPYRAAAMLVEWPRADARDA